MNGWLWAATVLLAAVLPLVLVAARRDVFDGVIAMEAAGADVTLALLLVAQGTEREPFADVALVAGVVSFIGSVGFVRLLGRVRS